MCITNDDAINNGSKGNNVMGKNKMLEEGKGKKEEGNDKKVITIEEKKQIEVATKMKEKK